jgi:hypothetical protein
MNLEVVRPLLPGEHAGGHDPVELEYRNDTFRGVDPAGFADVPTG